MYNDDVTRIPTDSDDLWDVLEEQFEFVRHVLWDLPVETRQEAIENTRHNKIDGDVQRHGMTAIRYRNVSGEVGQLDYFLDMGRKLLPYIDQAIDEQKLTPEFVQQWGKIMFCHGYVASYVFDDADDLSDARKGTGGRKDLQKRWVANILTVLIAAGHKDEAARSIAGRYVRSLVDQRAYPKGFGEKWFRKMADSEGALATTYDASHMYPKIISGLVEIGKEGLPPIPKLAELEQFANPN